MEYKNITKKDLTLPNIGIVKAGETVQTKEKINNKNFELVKENTQTPRVENLSNNKTT